MEASPQHHVGVGPLLQAVHSLVTPPSFAAIEPAHADLSYRPRPWPAGVAPRVDVYLPSGPGPHPSVLLVHGGGFVIGSRSMKPMRYLASRLVAEGFAVASVDYRLLFRGARKLEHGVSDVQAALAWWWSQRDRFDLDPDAITLAGLSAGATLSLLAAGLSVVPLARVVSVFALYDLSGLSGRLPRLLARLLGQGSPARIRQASPLHQPLFPAPLTVLHGTADALTPVEQAERYVARRREAALPTELHLYEGQPHGFFNEASLPIADQAFGDLLAALPRPVLA